MARPGPRLPRLLPAALTLAACGGDGTREAAPAPHADAAPIAAPAQYVTDLARSEAAALAVHDDLERSLLAGLAAGDDERAQGALAPGFRALLPGPEDGTLEADGDPARGSLRVRRFGPGGDPVDGAGFVEGLRAHLGALALERAEVEADRFFLAPDARTAVAHLELRLAGERPRADGGGSDDLGGLRVDLRLAADAELALGARGSWVLTRLAVEGGTRVEGRATFREVTRETGCSEHVSAENRALLQAFVDEHRTFALGGLTALDWNADGFWDLVATRRGQLATLLLNDGAGGFVPGTLPAPLADPAGAGSFLLAVDLDGDGRDELVSSAVLAYEGERAWCGLFTRGADGAWEHRPKALELPNPAGLRLVSIQTVVPFDLEGDGDLDLFLAVYGSARSRGEDYNTVEAHDGADNHLLVNQGGLVFTEESAGRGIHGTQYTYVATAFDFDRDGDADLFEGNDFGPNVLWRNDGRGHFLADDELGFGGVPAYTMGATLADYDNSGRWSLYVSNMSSEDGGRIVGLAPLSERMRATCATIATGNMLYTQGADGRWVERGVALGVNECEWAWGCVFWDPDGDGDRDLFVTNGFASHHDREAPDWQTYYWRQVVADGGFLERGERSVDVNRGVPFEGSFNGWERDRLFVNVGGADAPLAEAAYVAGLDAEHDGRCPVPVDVDGDGDLDLALWTLGGLVLYENLSPPAHFARVALEGRAGHAVGAEVALTAGGVTQRSVLAVVDGFQSQAPTDLHFGLGAAEGADAIDRIERVEVRWPSGASGVWRDLPVDRRLVLREGVAEARVVEVPRWPQATRPRGAQPGAEPGAPTLVLAGEGAADRAAGWRERPDLRVEVLPDDDAARRSALLGEGDASPAAALVFDREGRLARTFRRAPADGELTALLAALEDEPPFPELAVMTGRRALDEGRPRVAERWFRAALEQQDLAPAWEGLGRAHVTLGRLAEAAQAYARAVAADPDYVPGHFNLGATHMAAGRPDAAVAPFAEAARLAPQNPRHWMALGEAAALAGEREGALEAFTRAGQLDPALPDAPLNRGKLLGALGRYDEAATAFRAALALDPTSGEARRGLALVERLMRQEGGG